MGEKRILKEGRNSKHRREMENGWDEDDLERNGVKASVCRTGKRVLYDGSWETGYRRQDAASYTLSGLAVIFSVEDVGRYVVMPNFF